MDSAKGDASFRCHRPGAFLLPSVRGIRIRAPDERSQRDAGCAGAKMAFFWLQGRLRAPSALIHDRGLIATVEVAPYRASFVASVELIEKAENGLGGDELGVEG